MKLSIIIVNYNAGDYLRKCLESLNKNVSKKLNFEVIVVDNDSPDKSADIVEKEFKNFTLIRTKNEGFSKGNNKGVAKSKGDYVLFLNPDTEVYKGSLETMVDFMDKTPECGASTCRVELANGEIDYSSHRGFPTPWNSFCYFLGLSKLFPKIKLFSGYTMSYASLKKTHEIDALAGAFMMTRREAGEQVGWWDEDYFFNGEDIDFCYELKQKGWKIYYVPEVKILHYGGVFLPQERSKFSTLFASIHNKSLYLLR